MQLGDRAERSPTGLDFAVVRVPPDPVLVGIRLTGVPVWYRDSGGSRSHQVIAGSGWVGGGRELEVDQQRFAVSNHDVPHVQIAMANSVMMKLPDQHQHVQAHLLPLGLGVLPAPARERLVPGGLDPFAIGHEDFWR
jgi:hypothetical protein